MKTIIASESLILGLLLIGLGFSPAGAQNPSVTLKKAPIQSTNPTSGKEMFREYCAVCHGVAGKGDGPAAAALKVPPTDLTQLAARNGGKFDDAKVQYLIKGEADEPIAHGTKDMPVWGAIFEQSGHSDAVASMRVHNLVRYVGEIQAK